MSKGGGEHVSAHAGELFVVLGPDGAGKTSTMRMIGCASPPSAGEAVRPRHGPLRDVQEIRTGSVSARRWTTIPPKSEEECPPWP
jgi:lipooligosaccharide transport system ATP-binding protein